MENKKITLEKLIYDLENLYSNDSFDYNLEESIKLANDIKKLQQELSKTKKENEILTKNAEHNDKVVDKVNWENMFLKDKLKKIEEYCESTKEKYKYYNECNTTDVRVISKIIKGDE